jgi:hypothetical protein
MNAFVQRRTSRAALWSRRLAFFAAVLFVISGLGHRFGRIDTVSFFWLLGIVGAVGITALCAAAYGFSRLWEHGEKAGRDSTVGLLLALIVLTPFIISAWRVIAYPGLTDISTDLVSPPELTLAAKERTGAMNPIEPQPRQIVEETAELQLSAYPGVIGRRYEVAPDLVLSAVLNLARDRRWTVRGTPVMTEGEREFTVEMVAYTFFLGFPSDVAIRLIDEDASIYVDMRSASRYGKHDLGDNARRIEAFLLDLDAAVKAEPIAE